MNAKTPKSIGPPTKNSAAPHSPSRASRLEPVAKPKQQLLINIGIDFGTSSTKVIFSDRQFMPKYVCTFHENPEGYPPVCLPSTVRVVDGRVYFGDQAEQRTGGIVYRSFKMCMGCRPSAGICTSCPNPLGGLRRPGLLLLDAEGSGFVTAEEIAAWYLCYVVGLARGRVTSRYPGQSTRLTYQTSAPLKSCEDSVEKRAFEVAIHIASRIADGVEQGIRVGDLRSLYRVQMEHLENEGLPDEAERDTCVIPETHAGMVGFVRSPWSERGLYAIVDVGAGTTDISFLRLSVDDDYLAYYSSEVAPLGGDAVDREIMKRLVEKFGRNLKWDEPQILSQIRAAKEVDASVRMIAGMKTDRALYVEAAKSVGTKIFSYYKRVWVSAYKKEMKQKSWQHYTLYLCGGGSRLRPTFPDIFAQRPKPQSRVVESVDVRQFNLPNGLEFDSEIDTTMDNFGYLLLVAYGVAFHRPRIPEWIASALVEPLEINREPVPRSWDDYGKDGQWW